MGKAKGAYKLIFFMTFLQGGNLFFSSLGEARDVFIDVRTLFDRIDLAPVATSSSGTVTSTTMAAEVVAPPEVTRAEILPHILYGSHYNEIRSRIFGQDTRFIPNPNALAFIEYIAEHVPDVKIHFYNPSGVSIEMIEIVLRAIPELPNVLGSVRPVRAWEARVDSLQNFILDPEGLDPFIENRNIQFSARGEGIAQLTAVSELFPSVPDPTIGEETPRNRPFRSRESSTITTTLPSPAATTFGSAPLSDSARSSTFETFPGSIGERAAMIPRRWPEANIPRIFPSEVDAYESDRAMQSLAIDQILPQLRLKHPIGAGQNDDPIRMGDRTIVISADRNFIEEIFHDELEIPVIEFEYSSHFIPARGVEQQRRREILVGEYNRQLLLARGPFAKFIPDAAAESYTVNERRVRLRESRPYVILDGAIANWLNIPSSAIRQALTEYNSRINLTISSTSDFRQSYIELITNLNTVSPDDFRTGLGLMRVESFPELVTLAEFFREAVDPGLPQLKFKRVAASTGFLDSAAYDQRFAFMTGLLEAARAATDGKDGKFTDRVREIVRPIPNELHLRRRSQDFFRKGARFLSEMHERHYSTATEPIDPETAEQIRESAKNRVQMDCLLRALKTVR